MIRPRHVAARIQLATLSYLAVPATRQKAGPGQTVCAILGAGKRTPMSPSS
jgi:hypothetical protein